MAQTIQANDFSGGVTDYYLNCPATKSKVCDNLLITQTQNGGKLKSRFGSKMFSSLDLTTKLGASDVKRVGTAVSYRRVLYAQLGPKLFYFNTSTSDWTEVIGFPATSTIYGPPPGRLVSYGTIPGKSAFYGSTASTYFTSASWGGHLLFASSDRKYPKKVFKRLDGTVKALEAGLPKFNSVGYNYFVPSSQPNGTYVWLYKFVYKQTYTDSDNITYVDYGTPSAPLQYKSITSTFPATVTLTELPVIANGAEELFWVDNLKVEVFRTVLNGSVYYSVGEFSNMNTSTIAGSYTTFTDTVTDTVLQTKPLLYTEGGILGNDRPPRSRLVHVNQDIAYYADLIDSTNQVFTNRIQQSVRGDVDSCPESFYLDVNDDIIGLSSTKSNVLLLCKNSIYRIDGYYDELGMGGMSAERISDTANCVSAQSVVQALDGVFWAGSEGVYFSDGFKVERINIDFDKTYKTYVTTNGVIDFEKCKKIHGKYDKTRNRIWWAVQTGNVDVDTCYILDLNQGIGKNSSFTTATGGSSFSPTAIEFIDGDMVRFDRRGYALIHKDQYTSDLIIDELKTPSNFQDQEITYTYETSATDFGSAFSRKYVTGVTVSCESPTSLNLQITSNSDDGRVVSDLLPILNRNGVSWGEPDVYWGDSNYAWSVSGLINQKRRMPAGAMRCNFKSLKFSNAKVPIVNSDLAGNCTVDNDVNSATLVGTSEWPLNSIGYYIAFESDGFSKEYLITARTASTVLFSDPLNTSPRGTYRWIVRGYPKGEVLSLLGFTVTFDTFGPTQDPYRSAESGEVGT